MAFHEGKACDAVVHVLEAREGHHRSDVHFPEQECHAAPIELTCRIGERLFAFEHTGIEPFAGHVQLQAEADRHFRPLERRLAGKLPPNDVFELHIPAKSMQGLSTREVQRIQAALAAWIEATAPTIEAAPYARYVTSVHNVRPPGVPFDASLYRFVPAIPFPHGVPFQIRHLITGDLEHEREQRVRRACDKKFPKLAAWRRDSGARTVLILEDNDLQLTNPQRVFDVLVEVERTAVDKPDEIHLVSTMIANPWYVHALRIDDRTYYGLSEARLCMTEIDSTTLIDLTGR